MKTYKNFIKKEYLRLFEQTHALKYKVGDKVRIERLSGKGTATINGVENWPTGPAYINTINWDDRHELSKQTTLCEYFEEGAILKE